MAERTEALACFCFRFYGIISRLHDDPDVLIGDFWHDCLFAGKL
jgi:hypothetical protein